MRTHAAFHLATVICQRFPSGAERDAWLAWPDHRVHAMKIDLKHYGKREHAKAKHELLKRYITRYTMILGQRVSEIVFVDGFAGPWKSGASDRSDTSFGLSAAALTACAETLYARFQRRPTIKALWIEEDAEAFALLSEFATSASSSRVKIEAKQGTFQESIKAIVEFIGADAQAFIFVDPQGYKNMIEPAVLAPLLRLPRAELLINYMWGHIRYAFGHSGKPAHVANLDRLYGAELPRLLKISDRAQRTDAALQVYEQRLRDVSNCEGRDRLRVLSYPIFDTHGQRYPKYWLVHATHAATGVTTFADECEGTNKTQSDIFFAASAIRREHRTGTADLFGNDGPTRSPLATPATDAWTDLLPSAGDSITIDTEKWADLLERCRCLPMDLQAGFKRLLDDGVLENCDAKGKRRKHFVHPEDDELVRRLK